MAKGREIIPAQPGMGIPDFSGILSSEGLSIGQKRSRILTEMGLKKVKKKYETSEERKAAAKERAGTRKAERNKILEQLGIAPKRKGPKRTKAEKKVLRSQKSKDRRAFIREMAKENPEIAKKYGVDISRFKI